ncbi:MAG: hypothetical protein P8Z49_06030 [Acidobacteriota bacterium]|jgi:hypothetical protein
MEKSDKTLLERLADKVPGLSGYRAREDRRTSDKRLREFIAGRIDALRAQLDDRKLALTDAGRLDDLETVGRLQRELQAMGDSIRYASYGYSGMFDQLKIDDPELQKLYQQDLSVLDALETLERSFKDSSEGMSGARQALTALQNSLDARRTLFEAP